MFYIHNIHFHNEKCDQSNRNKTKTGILMTFPKVRYSDNGDFMKKVPTANCALKDR